MSTHKITPEQILNLKTIEAILNEKQTLTLSPEAKKKIVKCRNYLDKKLSAPFRAGAPPIYGINTGFGSLYNKSIPDKDLEKLQENLVMSHACGVGEEVPQEIVKLMLLLKIQGLSYGYSGVSVDLVDSLLVLYNHDVIPVIYTQGSLGASGDLAPLAHLSLPLIGKGEVYFEGKKQSAESVLKKLKLAPLKFKSKEALALLNGTQFMSAYAVWCLLNANRLMQASNMISAISLEAFDGRAEPFDTLIHSIRSHTRQVFVAKEIRDLLEGSTIITQKKQHVQDPYSFRCIPQVHGASWDAIDFFQHTVLTEINSVTDNPTIFPEADKIISGGNFHGQPLAIGFDLLAIALSELGNISERRIYQLISGQRGLPPFLVANPGLNSGFMIPQYTAASIVSQNKQLCTPASVDSIVSSNGQEDHVSMGANGATKCFKVVENLERILAIELFTATQGLEFRRQIPSNSPPGGEKGRVGKLISSPTIERIISNYRKVVKFITEDKVMYEEINKSVDFLRNQNSSL
ncbi:MAG: histidine ammonia-lyase [Bacteroidetes bacterium]|nr:MAG: histidine ammonia-lyase [Bacteroidota bacterium]